MQGDDSDEVPEDEWEDLPLPSQEKKVKLTKKQRVFEEKLIEGIMKHWDEIYKVAVKKKQRKIILSKDEYSINYDVKNRRELMLPPEFYLNLTVLEKYYIENYRSKDPDWDIGALRMFLARRYDIKGDLIHLSNIAKFCKVDMVNLFKKKFKPYQNKLLNKIKKRIKLKHARKKVDVMRKKRKGRSSSVFPVQMNSKVQSHALNKYVIKENLPKEMDSIKENDEEDEKISNISDHQSERISILDLITIINKKVKDLGQIFNIFSKKNKQGKGFMNIYSFNSFMGVELGLKLTSANKRGLFTVIDWNDDGYCTEKEFSVVFATTEEDIQKAIQDPLEYKDGIILDFVIEQIYHDMIMFKKEAVNEIEEKLNSQGLIKMSRLTKYLGFYKCKLTPIEIQLLEGTAEVDDKSGEKMIPFRRLIEK